MGTGCTRGTAALLVAVAVGALGAGCTDDPSDDHRDDHRGGGAQAARPANVAFLDVETSRAVSEQITPAVARFFSYDFRRLDEHAAQVMADTTARYWSGVEPSLEIVREVAPRKQAVATAEVVATALDTLEPGRATLLLFVNRTTTEAGGPAQQERSSVVVTAARIGPHWKIDGMTVL